VLVGRFLTPPNLPLLSGEGLDCATVFGLCGWWFSFLWLCYEFACFFSAGLVWAVVVLAAGVVAFVFGVSVFGFCAAVVFVVG